MKKKIALGILTSLFAFASYAQKAGDLTKQGNAAFRNSEYGKADSLYRKSLEIDPSFAEAQFNLGDALYKAEKYDEAAKQYDQIAENAPSQKMRAEALHNLGNTKLKLEDYTGSADAYKKSLRLNPGDEDTRYNLAYSQRMMQQQSAQQQGEQQNQQQQQGEQGQQNQQQQSQQGEKQNQQQQGQQGQQQNQQQGQQQNQNQQGHQGEQQQGQPQNDNQNQANENPASTPPPANKEFKKLSEKQKEMGQEKEDADEDLKKQPASLGKQSADEKEKSNADELKKQLDEAAKEKLKQEDEKEQEEAIKKEDVEKKNQDQNSDKAMMASEGEGEPGKEGEQAVMMNSTQNNYTKEDAERILKSLNTTEQQVQQKVKAKTSKSPKSKSEKDW